MSDRLIEKQVLYTGKKIRLEVHQIETDQGKRIKREVCVHPGAVVILPLLDDTTVLLIRNKRYAVDQTLLELPAGTLEPKEPPMNCAGRELLEETGYLARKIKPLTSFFSSPGILSEKMYAFLAYDLQKSKPALEEGEEIEIHPTALSEAIEMIKSGEIMDAKTIALILFYDRFHAGSTGT